MGAAHEQAEGGDSHPGSASKVFEPEGSITTNNAVARTAFVEAGHGIGRIPRYDADPKIRAGLLEEVLPGIQLPEIAIYGVFPPGAAMSSNLRLLLDFTNRLFKNDYDCSNFRRVSA